MKSSLAVFLALFGSNLAAETVHEIEDLDLESLLSTDVHITSAMRRTNVASETPASVYVISKEKIRDSGVTSVAQALALAPGVQVRKIDNNKWAIGIRNPSGRFSSKLLVMVDGQSIYNPAFAGVYWEALKIPVYDIERIEVVRGHGGLLWGSNATSGVVNVITKHSIDSRSTRLGAATGSTLEHRGEFRFGGDLEVGRYGSYRVYGSVEHNDHSDESAKWQPRDSGKARNIGGRIDVAISDETSLLFQGDYTEVKLGQTLGLPDSLTHAETEFADLQKRQHGQLMFRLDNQLSEQTSQMLQLSASLQKGRQLYAVEKFKHYDIDYQINTLIDDIQIDAGVNYRYNQTPFGQSDYITSQNYVDYIRQYGGFVQARFPFLDEKLNLILGNRSEHNSLTGWEHQPSARVTWAPNETDFFWGAISRGVRIPSLVEYDYQTEVQGVQIGDVVTTGQPLIDNLRLKSILRGSNTVEPETVVASELGYRHSHEKWNFDLSLFHSKAKNSVAVSPSIDPTVLPTVQGFLLGGDVPGAVAYLNTQSVDLNIAADAEVESVGTEIIVSGMLAPWISTEFGYSYAEYRQSNSGQSYVTVDGKTQQVFLAAHMKLAPTHRLYSQVRWEDGKIYNTDDFTALDITWNWDINRDTSVYVAGYNLLEDSHLEYARTSELFDTPTLIDRSFAIGITVDY